MKRFVALVLVCMMTLFIGAAAQADSDDARASNYFSSYGISLSKPGSSKINITFSCSTTAGTASQIGVSTYSVQRYDNGSWTAVTGLLNGSYAYNASNCFLQQQHNVVRNK